MNKSRGILGRNEDLINNGSGVGSMESDGSGIRSLKVMAKEENGMEERGIAEEKKCDFACVASISK